ncbi:MAG: proprotein convertase P-domain-containing protein [Armatimonadota bacterium]
MRFMAQATVAVLALCLIGPALAVEYPSTDTPLPITDYSNTQSTITVPSGGTITDLNVMVNISHTCVSDLDIRLTGPSGQECYFFYHAYIPGADFTGTVFDDEADNSIADGSAPFTGSFIPYHSLGVYDGLSQAGTWILDVYDRAGWDQGTLNSWSLIFENNDNISPALTVGSITPDKLWPPNGQMIPVTISGSASDEGSGVASLWCDVDDPWNQLDERHPMALDEDGNFSHEMDLQAARLETELDGRTYTLTVCVLDAAGNKSEQTVTVVVPHDNRDKKDPK